jgi:N-acetylneuraminate synthase/N,N'-diacetyllegionaminate synthase
MHQHFKIGNINIGSKGKVFVIAEIGVNHNGKIDLAKKLIIKAAEAGADCVKFQTFSANNLVNKKAIKAPYQIKNTNRKENQYEMLKKLELKRKHYPELIKLCKKKRLVFMSTPYNFDDVDFLHKIRVSAFKLSSMHLPETEFIKYVAKKNKPIIMSTGMGTVEEISTAINTMRKTKNKKLVLMQCTTNYPAKLKDSNLLVLPQLKKNSIVAPFQIIKSSR